MSDKQAEGARLSKIVYSKCPDCGAPLQESACDFECSAHCGYFRLCTGGERHAGDAPLMTSTRVLLVGERGPELIWPSWFIKNSGDRKE